MSWTYGGNPQTNRLDRIRALIGDIKEEEPLLEDEILNWLMDQDSNDFSVASKACNLIATRLSREADLTVGELSVKLSRLAENYRAAAAEFAQKSVEAAEAPLPVSSSAYRDPLFRIRQFDRRSS